MAKTTLQKIKNIDKRFLFFAAALAIGLFVLIPKAPNLKDTYSILLATRPEYLVLAIISMFLTFPAAAGVYTFLSRHPLSLYRTTIVSLAAIFVNKLLPASSGTLALNIKYLTKQKHSAVQATSIVAVNNLTGLIGHLTILLVVASLSDTPLGQSLVIRVPKLSVGLIMLAGLVIAIFVGLIIRFREKIQEIAREIADYVKILSSEPKRFLGALVCAMLITSGYAFALYFSALATGHPVSVLNAYYVLTIGVAAASLTPTPGGIGGAEIGLVAALASIGMYASWAVSIAILYRLITYWLPIIPGIFALHIANKKHYI